MRASEPVSCWPHKPCEWRSTRQPATKFGGVVQREDRWPATSRPGAKVTAGLIRGQGDPRGFASGRRVRFPPLPPSSPGRPLWSRRRSEKPDKHVRLVPLAPSVTVAEWLRRQTVDLSTRVQFPPVTPICAGVVQRRGPSVLTKKCRFDSGRLFQRLVGVVQLDE